jgi:hypothetical protein
LWALTDIAEPIGQFAVRTDLRNGNIQRKSRCGDTGRG